SDCRSREEFNAEGKSKLTPGIIDSRRGCVGEVHGAARGNHRDANFFGDSWVGEVLGGQAAWLGAEKQNIPVGVFDITEPFSCRSRKCKNSRAGKRVHARVEVRVDFQICQVMVVKTCAFEVFIVKVKTQWFH